MSKLIKISLIGLIFLTLLPSCQDSLGIVNNPEKEYIDKPPFKEKKFDVIAISDTIIESYVGIGTTELNGWISNFTFKTRKVQIDTSYAIPRLWFDIDVEYEYLPIGGKYRIDWVSNLKVRADSVEAFGITLLNEPQYIGKWLSLVIITPEQNRINAYSEKQLQSRISIYEVDKLKRIIVGSIESVLFFSYNHQTSSILYNFKLQY